MIATPEPFQRRAAEFDLDTLRKYAMYRQAVVRIFTDPERRKRLEKLAGQTGVVIPKQIFKGI